MNVDKGIKQKQSLENGGQQTFGRVDFFDASEDAVIIASFLGGVKTANNRFKSRYVRADLTELAPDGQAKNLGVKNLNLKRTVLRKEIEALESNGKLQSEPYVIIGRGEATTQDGATKYFKYEVLSLSDARRRGLVNN
jgi:hypothetical protein